MNPLVQLDSYLRRLERNLRLLSITRGAAILCTAALLVTVLLVLAANQFSFSAPSVFWSRVLLFFVVAAALCAGLIVPLLRLNRKRAAHRAEARYPEFKQRLLTFTEKAKANADDPFLPLLAADAMTVAGERAQEPLVPRSWLVSFGSVAAIAITVLLWLGISGPGFLGYGTALLWGGVPRADRKPIYSIRVEPGTHRIRRRADQSVTASLNGFTASKVSVFAKYASSPKWEEAPMIVKGHSSDWEFLFAGVPEDVEYYVSAGGVKSNSYKFTVVDLPAVKKIKVTYHYPSFLGMKDETEDPGGDLRAVEGTEAQVELETDKPLAQASLVLDSGTKIDFAAGPTGRLVARVPIQKDDMYHVATPDAGEMVRLTENYFIEARRDEPPTVTILHPGKDAKVSPIEEVAVNVQGKDDFGLQGLDLHYSVNGGEEKSVSVLNGKGRKEADGSTTIFLEDYKLVPGDVVSMYASARDARTTSRSDIYFIEAQPFEKEYSQSQAGGGKGQGGEEEQKISEREKEVIAATWNQLKAREKTSSAENAKYLADVQAKLRDQAQSLATRMKARQLSENNPAFKSFTEDMEQAVAAMGPASDQLRGQQFKTALTPEQKALQYLLRAEATFRQIQVAFGKGGGGGGQGAGRDLENMFDLELDTEKNQYENGQQSAADKQQKKVDDALAKLKDLARRQQELAQQQAKQQTAQQRWQQEMLRREAEELKREMEQLSRGEKGEEQQQGQQGQQGQEGQQGQQGQKGQSRGQQAQGQQSQGQQGQAQQSRRGNPMSSGQQRQLQQALSRLTEATRDMSSSASAQSRAQQMGESAGKPGEPGQSGKQSEQAKGQADARKAAERLQEAQDMLSAMRQQQSGEQMSDLVREADRLAKQQEGFSDRLRKNFGGGQGSEPSKQQLSQQMSQEKQGMIDDLNRLEQQMQRAAREMAQTQPAASAKLREGLGRMQQEEVQSRMKWTADALKRGMGGYAVMREAPVNQALGQVADDLRKAQAALGKGNGGKPGQGDAQQQAVQQAEKLRQQIEQMAQAMQQGKGQQQARGKGQRGQQPGGDQPGQQGQQGEQVQGQQAQGQQAQGQQGQGQQGQGGQGSSQSGSQQRSESAGPGGGGGPAIGDSYNEAVRDFSRLQQASRDNPEISKQLQQLGNELRGMNPRQNQNNPELLQRLIGQVLSDAQQIELTLRRKTDLASTPHATTPQAVPPGYSGAVAEYFRRLSK